MAASPPVVLDDLVEPEDFSVVLHHKTRDAFAEPVVESVLVACGFLEVVGVATFDDLPENREHLRKVRFFCSADMHIRFLLHYII